MFVNFNKKCGFTQSQTLLITGIVFMFLFACIAAPFYNFCKKKQTVVELKMLYSTLMQTRVRFISDNTERTGIYDKEISISKFAETYFAPYLNVKTYCSNSLQPCWKNTEYKDLKNRKIKNPSKYSMVLQDGTVIGFDKNKDNLVYLLVDINGPADPNKLGRDTFVIYFYENHIHPDLCPKEEYQKYYIRSGLHMGGYDKCGIPYRTHDYFELFSKNMAGSCNKKAPGGSLGAGAACAALIEAGDWNIDKIYPW